MATDINKVILIGRLTRDPELKSTNSGSFFCKITLAVNRSFYRKEGDVKEEVGFFDCIAWGKTAEIISKYLQKGRRVGIDGFLRFSSWENQEGKKQSKVEIQIENFQFLESRNGAQGASMDNQDQANYSGDGNQAGSLPMGAVTEDEVFGKEYPPMSDDEIPF